MTRGIPPTEGGETGSMMRHPGLLEGASFDTHILSGGLDLLPAQTVRNVPGHVSETGLAGPGLDPGR